MKEEAPLKDAPFLQLPSALLAPGDARERGPPPLPRKMRSKPFAGWFHGRKCCSRHALLPIEAEEVVQRVVASWQARPTSVFESLFSDQRNVDEIIQEPI